MSWRMTPEELHVIEQERLAREREEKAEEHARNSDPKLAKNVAREAKAKAEEQKKAANYYTTGASFKKFKDEWNRWLVDSSEAELKRWYHRYQNEAQPEAFANAAGGRLDQAAYAAYVASKDKFQDDLSAAVLKKEDKEIADAKSDWRNTTYKEHRPENRRKAGEKFADLMGLMIKRTTPFKMPEVKQPEEKHQDLAPVPEGWKDVPSQKPKLKPTEKHAERNKKDMGSVGDKAREARTHRAAEARQKVREDQNQNRSSRRAAPPQRDPDDYEPFDPDKARDRAQENDSKIRYEAPPPPSQPAAPYTNPAPFTFNDRSEEKGMVIYDPQEDTYEPVHPQQQQQEQQQHFVSNDVLPVHLPSSHADELGLPSQAIVPYMDDEYDEHEEKAMSIPEQENSPAIALPEPVLQDEAYSARGVKRSTETGVVEHQGLGSRIDDTRVKKHKNPISTPHPYRNLPISSNKKGWVVKRALTNQLGTIAVDPAVMRAIADAAHRDEKERRRASRGGWPVIDDAYADEPSISGPFKPFDQQHRDLLPTPQYSAIPRAAEDHTSSTGYGPDHPHDNKGTTRGAPPYHSLGANRKKTMKKRINRGVTFGPDQIRVISPNASPQQPRSVIVPDSRPIESLPPLDLAMAVSQILNHQASGRGSSSSPATSAVPSPAASQPSSKPASRMASPVASRLASRMASPAVSRPASPPPRSAPIPHHLPTTNLTLISSDPGNHSNTAMIVPMMAFTNPIQPHNEFNATSSTQVTLLPRTHQTSATTSVLQVSLMDIDSQERKINNRLTDSLSAASVPHNPSIFVRNRKLVPRRRVTAITQGTISGDLNQVASHTSQPQFTGQSPPETQTNYARPPLLRAFPTPIPTSNTGLGPVLKRTKLPRYTGQIKIKLRKVATLTPKKKRSVKKPATRVNNASKSLLDAAWGSSRRQQLVQ